MAAHEPEAGAVIDGFRLEEALHRGGMATLWRVSHAEHALPLIMKIPRLRADDDPAAIVGFEVEQMILPRLAGPHVPRFVAAGDFSTQPYLVMERVPGESLRARLAQAPLPAEEVADIGTRVALALQALHAQHVIHLDVKPSNVLFRPDGAAVLIDFGLSHHTQLPDLLAEQFHLPMGTGPYIAPEQVLGVRSDPRSDLFALGVTLYHLATGERPFGNPTSVAGLRRRLYRDPLPPRALKPELPRWLQEVILRCLEVDADARYASAAQLAFDLQHPAQVALSPRAERTARDGLFARWRRWFRAIGHEPEHRVEANRASTLAPIVVAAIDVIHGEEALAEALRTAVARHLATGPGVRLACVTVQRVPRIGMDTAVDREGRNRHVKRLVALKNWARPLELPPERLSFHVLEAPDAADALLDYARNNRVDHIVMGARASSSLRRFLGSVSARVVAEAPCSVTVVRATRETARGEAVAAAGDDWHTV
ncbi:MAG TPA: bifunctional serine/threonine-protein kinase/universal stress protein [Rhodanobacteraceae bacterium]|nr:bifunctional serine/threonine-protein kinase/universal stress protein [Rhodanobacteraceae bacterium]